MGISILNEVKYKHSINSDKKKKPTEGSNVVPDEANLQTCLNCPLPECKPRCGLLKRKKK